MKKVYLFCSMLLLCACSPVTKTEVKLLSEDFHPKDRTIFLLDTHTEYITDIRLALSEYKFSVPMFSSQKTIYEKKSDKITEQYKAASTRYGLLLHRDAMLDWCTLNPGVNIRYSGEIMDVDTNKVVAVIKTGGWTEHCPTEENELVFEKIAKALDELWSFDIKK